MIKLAGDIMVVNFTQKSFKCVRIDLCTFPEKDFLSCLTIIDKNYFPSLLSEKPGNWKEQFIFPHFPWLMHPVERKMHSVTVVSQGFFGAK